MMRILVKLEAGREILVEQCCRQGERAAALRRLGISHMAKADDKAANDRLLKRLAITLTAMEQRADQYIWNASIEANLQMMGKALSLSQAERTILVLAAMLRADDELSDIASRGKSQANVIAQVRSMTGLSIDKVRDALLPQSTLSRSRLIEVAGGGNLSDNLRLRRGRFRCLVTGRLKSLDQLFTGILSPARASPLTRADYSHLHPDFDFISSVMSEALKTGRRGVNVLLYGPPGTGKTELTRVIAKVAGVPLYEVSCMDEDGVPVDARTRLSNASTAQNLLMGRKTLLAFDEVDAIFTDGSAFFGKPTTAEQSKAWVNELLERGQVPTFWVANSIWRMDPAFVRRFDVVVEMKAPPLSRRVELLKAQCGTMLDAGQARRIAQLESITPALVARAVSVMRRTRVAKQNQSATLETLLDGTLAAQGHKTIKRMSRSRPAYGYDPDLCNASVNLNALAVGVANSGVGRICLYGPPGTGKTAFGYWLAEQLGKPLMLKRVSDIQSPFLGIMEQKLADAFEDAARNDAVLQIDEVDTFLRDRSEARQAWEVSQVNEFLTQLEGYEGVFIASTNLMGGLDPAALRRFDYKVEMGYLHSHQANAMLANLLRHFRLDDALSTSTRKQLGEMQTLTPGDFAVLIRQHRIKPFTCAGEAIKALAAEVAGKAPLKPRRIGFV
jgi:SpoVK/Ycf46/Vps4 family AAA+-type ATPase